MFEPFKKFSNLKLVDFQLYSNTEVLSEPYLFMTRPFGKLHSPIKKILP